MPFAHFFVPLAGKNMKLSIIIPVYNAEKTLDRCVESILSQEFCDYEIILVDDGSPDRSPTICDRWAEKDGRIRVIHKENGGPGDARNAGINTATGEWFTFIDSDDAIEKDTLRPLMEVTDKHPEIKIFEYPIRVKGTWNYEPQDKAYPDVETYWSESRAYEHTFSCNKIFRRELFDGLSFPKGRIVGEDAWLFPQLLRRAGSVATTGRGCYIYYDNPESISSTADGNQLARLLEIHLSDGMPIDTSYFLYLLNIQLDVFRMTGKLLLDGKYHTRINEAKGVTAKLKLLTYKILGLKNLCKLHKIAQSL